MTLFKRKSVKSKEIKELEQMLKKDDLEQVEKYFDEFVKDMKNNKGLPYVSKEPSEVIQSMEDKADAFNKARSERKFYKDLQFGAQLTKDERVKYARSRASGGGVRNTNKLNKMRKELETTASKPTSSPIKDSPEMKAIQSKFAAMRPKSKGALAVVDKAESESRPVRARLPTRSATKSKAAAAEPKSDLEAKPVVKFKVPAAKSKKSEPENKEESEAETSESEQEKYQTPPRPKKEVQFASPYAREQKQLVKAVGNIQTASEEGLRKGNGILQKVIDDIKAQVGSKLTTLVSNLPTSARGAKSGKQEVQAQSLIKRLRGMQSIYTERARFLKTGIV